VPPAHHEWTSNEEVFSSAAPGLRLVGSERVILFPEFSPMGDDQRFLIDGWAVTLFQIVSAIVPDRPGSPVNMCPWSEGPCVKGPVREAV